MARQRAFPPLYPPVWAARFWRHVHRPDSHLGPPEVMIPDPEACWEWQGALDTDGYGVFDLNGQSRPAHKVAYELKVGPVYFGEVLLHSCDNPCCCNYHHLSKGTQADNMQDMVAKGRHGNRYTSPVGQPVESSRLAKKLEHQVCEFCGAMTTDLPTHLANCMDAAEAKAFMEDPDGS
jgi:hypothetical protein